MKPGGNQAGSQSQGSPVTSLTNMPMRPADIPQQAHGPDTGAEGGAQLQLHHRLNGHADSCSLKDKDKLSDIALHHSDPIYANYQAVNAKDLELVSVACPVMFSRCSGVTPVPQSQSSTPLCKNKHTGLLRPVPSKANSTYSNYSYKSTGPGLQTFFNAGSLFNLRGVGVTSQFGYIEDEDELELEDELLHTKVGVNLCQPGRQVKASSNFYHPGSPGQFCGNRRKVVDTTLALKDHSCWESLHGAETSQDVISVVENEFHQSSLDGIDSEEYTDMSANMKLNGDIHLCCNGVGGHGEYGYGYNLTEKGRGMNGEVVQYGGLEETDLDMSMPPSSPPPLPPVGVPPLRLKKLRRSLSHRSIRENRRRTQDNNW